MKVSMRFIVDLETSRKAVALFKELGMSLSTGVELFLKQALREDGLPFQPTLSKEEIEQMEVDLAQSLRGEGQDIWYDTGEEEILYD
ncbi:hypothetical protein CL176_06685 [Suicoccus acidiformans]|uniref:Type II toxin-antitoxin system antitoxin, RelB/DinJ family n=1 Tax=Suicoccus acidiformans TaxID=2036206 RepID=A0A347WKV2_9LACT|nr:type II toxin-antitoxin system RelB/DinJ family antitoxin [Suicoccus acidiformans]AXY25709.1 hypothetical protein CL176_06685 [Suicoccus acidiformans]